MSEKLSEDELKGLLQAEIRSSTLYTGTELSPKRARAMEYYAGTMNDVPAAKGRSSVTSRDVADTIGWVLPGIVRVFTASDQMAVCEPERPNDEEGSKQATDYLNYVFWKENPGYRILWDATHDALLQANAVTKVYWDDAEDCTYTEHTRLMQDQLTMLLEEEGVELVSSAENEEPELVEAMDPMTGQPIQQQVPTYDAKLKRVNKRGKLVVKCIKPEDFLMDPDAIRIEDARFVAERAELTRSQLVEMGFDHEKIEALAGNQVNSFSEESLARTDNLLNYSSAADESMEIIEIFECYLKVDVNDDGIAETVRAYLAGGRGDASELLDWEVWDSEHPFHDIKCEPVPHRWDGRSVADDTMDVQRVKTVLLRQALDNLYMSNNPQREAVLGSVSNPDEMLNPTLGGVIWRKSGSEPIRDLAVPFVAGNAFDALNYFDQVIEKRTGVSRSTMALDPQALQNQTATAAQNSKDAAYSQIELIARNMAEDWRNVFRHILRLIVKHQDRKRTIRLRDKWVEMDPRSWNANMDVTVNVGLGTGSRDRDMQMLQGVLQNQTMLVQAFQAGGFMDKALAMTPKILNTMRKIAESAGIKSVDAYYPEISEEDLAGMMQQASERSQQPTMEDKQLQADIQLEQAKAQAAQAKEAAQMQADMAVRQQDFQIQQYQTDQEMQFKYAQLAQQREIELLKLGAMEEETTGEDGQPVKKVKSKNDQSNETIMNGFMTLGAMLEKMQQGIHAPKMILRDEQGRAAGVQSIAPIN